MNGIKINKMKVYTLNRENSKKVRVAINDSEKMGIEFGTPILIKGKTTQSVAIVVPCDNIFKGKIGIDFLLAESLGIKQNDDIQIEICKYKDDYIDKVIFRTDIDKNITYGIIKKIKKDLIQKYINYPFYNNDIITLEINGEHKSFQIINISNEAISYLKNTTNIIFRYNASSIKSKKIFEKIGGLKKQKKIFHDIIIKPLQHPELYRNFGNIKSPKGILIHGNKGCGKTLFVNEMVNKTNTYIIKKNATDIFQKFYGASEDNVKKMFNEAIENQPSIIIIDNFDSIGSNRQKEGVGQIERRVISQFFTEMDNITNNNNNVITIAITNKLDVIDEDFRRTGRLDYEIEITPPTKNERLEILKIHTKGIKFAKDIDFNHIATITNGYVGSDILGLITESVRLTINYYTKEEDFQSVIPKSKLNKMIITSEILYNALKNIKPSIIRDSHEIPNITMNDIGGLENCKKAIEESVIWRIHPPKNLKKIGVKPPQGILLYGPHGCGKTLLGKASANQVGSNFISIKGPEIVSKWVGESEKKLREKFDMAKKLKPCVIFIDEIDAIASQRNLSDSNDGGTSYRIVDQLLTLLDGISDNEGIVVIGATNRPDILDKSFIRTGRIDYLIHVPLPDIQARKKIFEIHLKNVNTKNIDIDTLVKLTDKCTGSDIESSIKHAATIAVRNERDYITINDIQKSLNEKITQRVDENIIAMYENFQKQHNNNIEKKSDLYC